LPATTLAALATLPDGTKTVALLLAWCGAPEKGEEAIRPLRTFGPLLADQVSVMPYTALQSIAENFNPRGLRNYWKTSYLAGTSDEAIEAMVEYHTRVPSPYTHQVIYTFGGAVARVGKDQAAVSYRDTRHAFIVIRMWDNAARDEEQISYVRGLLRAVQPHSSGGFYPNYEPEAPASEMQSAFGAEKYERLRALKRKYDPDNFFHLNQTSNPLSNCPPNHDHIESDIFLPSRAA
jgi:hypothetical protein